MKAKIIKKTKDLLLISWAKPKVGFGELTMKWNQENGTFDLDAELMGIDFIIEVFKAIEIK